MIQIGVVDRLEGIRNSEDNFDSKLEDLLNARDLATAAPTVGGPAAGESTGGGPSAVFPGGGKTSSNDLFPFLNETEEPGPRGLGRRLGGIFWGTKLRRAGTLVGIFGAGGAVGGVMLFSVVSGPLEFVHIGQTIGLNFTHIRIGGSSRLAKLTVGRFFGIKNMGDTRLNFLTRAYKNRILADMEQKGIKPQFEKGTTRFSGYEIDANKLPDGTFKGNEAATQDQLAELLRLPKDRILPIPDSSGANKFLIQVGPDGKIPGLNDAAPVLDGMVRLTGVPRVVQWANARVLGDYGLVFRNWHVLRRIETAFGSKVQENFLQSLQKFQKSNAPEEVLPEDARLEGHDKNGKTTTSDIPDAPTGAPTVDNTKSAFDSLKEFAKSPGGKVAGGVITAITLIVCILYAVAQKYHDIQYAQVVVPMIKMGTTILSVATQIQSGQDVNPKEVDAIAEQFNTIDPKTFQSTSTWSDAAAIKAAQGQTGGIDVSQDLRGTFAGTPGWLAWTNTFPIPQFCGPFVSIAGLAIGIITDFTVIGLVVNVAVAGLGILTVPHIVDWIANFLAGNAVNVAASGAEWGNYISYGTKLAANAQALQYGGVQLTDKQVSELDQQSRMADALEFHQQSLAYRIFNPNDYRTVVGSMIDRLGLSSPRALFAKILDIPGLVGDLLSLPASLFSSTVHAAPQPYKWPFPEFGFSEEDLNNKLVADPADNAVAVSKILDQELANGDNTYIGKALDCFGVAITKGPDGWDAVPSISNSSTDQDRSKGVNPYDDQKYNTSDCVGSGDSTWLQIRFWIFDTRLMEGYACTLGDDVSCSETGFVTAAGV